MMLDSRTRVWSCQSRKLASLIQFLSKYTRIGSSLCKLRWKSLVFLAAFRNCTAGKDGRKPLWPVKDL